MISDFVDELLFGTKVCPCCGQTKIRNSEHFARDTQRTDGLTPTCRVCRRGFGKRAYEGRKAASGGDTPCVNDTASA